MKRPVGTVRDFPLGSLIVVEMWVMRDIDVVLFLIVVVEDEGQASVALGWVCVYEIGERRGIEIVSSGDRPRFVRFVLLKERATVLLFRPPAVLASIVTIALQGAYILNFKRQGK